MISRLLHIVASIVMVCMLTSDAVAQPEYYMSDTTVTDCEGILFDSEAGDLSGHYDHNEDYSFTICIAGADQILLDFNYFHSEQNLDQIWFYDGPDAAAPLIAGPFSGRVTIPQIVASSGCLTVRFITDPNVAEPGWRAQWRTSNFAPPTAPDISLVTMPTCPLSELLVTVSSPIHCDSLYAGALRLTGPKLVDITSVEAVGCSGDSTTQFRVRFTPPLDFGGRYKLRLRTVVPYCTTPYVLYSNLEFVLSGCPLAIRLLVRDADALCTGDFTRVRAQVTGGIRGTYRYNWQPFPSTRDTMRVGPINGPTVVSVDVTDASGGFASASITITPLEAPTILGGDRNFCQSLAAFDLVASPPNGQWRAAGMYYGYDAYQTLYEPQLTDGVSDLIEYEAPNGCRTSVTYTFTPLDYGTDDAACPGAPPFAVSGGLPAGGAWTGPNISSDGTFSPTADTGTYTVTYTHPNGCSGSKQVHVGLATSIALDTFCESEPRIELDIEPRGGVWTGDGLADGSRGWFSPGSAGPGAHTLRYFAEGCADRDVEIFVKEIDAGDGFTACPDEDPRILPGNWRPAGGTWYGRGIVDPTAGLFDPKLFGLGVDTLTYHAPNGCSDRRSAAVFYTLIRPADDTLLICTADDRVLLTPGGEFFQAPRTGIWQGPGVVIEGDKAFFDPIVAGIGVHDIVYVANTCAAPLVILVGQSPNWQGDTICITSDPLALPSAAPGTEWAGPGIINPLDGIFDASVSGEGMHEIYAVSLEGCVEVADIYVPEDVTLAYQAPDAVACFSESEIDLQLSPTDVRISSNGNDLGNTLTSAELGEGRHQVVLSAGEPACADVDSFSMEVLLALRLSAKPYPDTLCFGDGTRLELEVIGGIESARVFAWADPAGGQRFGRTVQPTRTTTYRASVSDGCSDDVSLALPVFVHPEITFSTTEGPIVCHYDSTTSVVQTTGVSAYAVRWQTFTGEFEGETYRGSPGYYDVEIADLRSGCTVDTEVQLPGYEPIVASFSPNPNDCIEPNAEPVIFLDRSRGATSGRWSFPDGTTLAYEEGTNPTFSFPDTGIYQVTLNLSNDGGCVDADSLEVCVAAITRLYLPTAFTPNGDDLNDQFRLVGTGVTSIEWRIVDRWGTIVFAGSSMDDGWDGTHKGSLVQEGRYTLRAIYQDASGRQQKRQGTLMVLR